MLEIQVKNKYSNGLYGDFELREFANSINDETVIIFSPLKKNCIILYQKEFDEICVKKILFSEFKIALSRDLLTMYLKNSKLPTKCTLIKAEERMSYTFVSEKYHDGCEICLLEKGPKDFYWESISKTYSKEKHEVINLGGKIQE